jgi:hypothetical protein
LVDLLRAVRAGIAGIWDQRGNRAPFNFICWPFWLQNMFSWVWVVPRSLRPYKPPLAPVIGFEFFVTTP